jgi:hypothetical protein
VRSVDQPGRPDRYGPGFWRPFRIVVAAWFGLGLVSSAISRLVHPQDAFTTLFSALPLALIAVAAAFAPHWVVRVDPPAGGAVRFHTLFRAISVQLADIRSVQIGRSRRLSMRYAGGRLYLSRRTRGWAEALDEARRVNPDLPVVARSPALAVAEEALWSLPFGVLLGLVVGQSGVILSATHSRLTGVLVGAAGFLFMFAVGMVRWRHEARDSAALVARRMRGERRGIRTPRTWWVLPTAAGLVAGIGWAAVNWFAGTPPHHVTDTFLALVAAGSSTFVFWLGVVLVWRHLSSNRGARGGEP